MTTAILITNVGTPDAHTPQALRSYLNEFLNDEHIVRLPRWIWWPILYGFILPFRSPKSAKLYQKIWTEDGSPLLINSKLIANKLSEAMNLPVMLGMNYGKPSIENVLSELKSKKINKLLVLPLFPQYSTTTTAASVDKVVNFLSKLPDAPQLKIINSYSTHERYINALTSAINRYWDAYGKPKHLIFSFHGLPTLFENQGDPYAQQCNQTVQAITQQLSLAKNEYTLSFQSRLGYGTWLSPYTDKVLQALPTQGIRDVHVVCPGFSVDCLETLEEIAIRGKEQFLQAGGKSFHYIPALNDSQEHILCLQSLINENIQNGCDL